MQGKAPTSVYTSSSIAKRYCFRGAREAIAQEQNAEIAEGFVIRQLRKGYRLKDRLIRPANVVVSKGAPVGVDAATPGAGT